MKKTMLLSSSLILSACATQPEPTPPKIGMANPASVYCQKLGGKSIPQQDKDGGSYALCQLPNGELIEEWELFRRDHPQK